MKAKFLPCCQSFPGKIDPKDLGFDSCVALPPASMQSYEVDPMLCPHCGAEMRLMALIEDEPVIEKILRHLHLWEPRPPSQAPPTEDIDWPSNSQLPMTHVPLPDIA